MKEITKTVKDLKVEIEAITKTQTDEFLKMENLGKKTGTTETSIINRIQEMEERISGAEIPQKTDTTKKI